MKSNYEQARDEAAEFTTVYGKTLSPHEKEIWIAGADWHRDYAQKLNADLFADNKLMKETLELISSPSEWNCEIGESNQRSAAVKTLSQIKGKYDE